MKEKNKIIITTPNISSKQWSTLLLELNLMKSSWRPFGVKLEKAQSWEKDFLETERQIAISDQVTQALGKDSPITTFLINFISFPTLCLTFIKKGLIYQSYKKCKKEIELIQEEMKKYE